MDHLTNEVTLHSQLKHPFIVPFEGISQDSQAFFIKEKWMPNGDLFHHVIAKHNLSEEQTRFIVAQIVLVFEYLQKKHIIYRDLKPENVLVQNSGYVALADFGFAKKVDPKKRTYSFVGTPEYISPEINKKTGHNFESDWYTIGIFTYELLHARCPFTGNSTTEIAAKAASRKMCFRKEISEVSRDFMTQLTAQKIEDRLGSKGAEEVKNHPYFEGMDWEKLEQMKLQSPFVPRSKP